MSKHDELLFELTNIVIDLITSVKEADGYSDLCNAELRAKTRLRKLVEERTNDN